jgi:hypothetical protein
LLLVFLRDSDCLLYKIELKVGSLDLLNNLEFGRCQLGTSHLDFLLSHVGLGCQFAVPRHLLAGCHRQFLLAGGCLHRLTVNR